MADVAGTGGPPARRPCWECTFDPQALQSEGRPGAVAQESLSAGVVAAGDADRGIDAEATGRLPGEQVGDGGLVEEVAASKEAEHAVTQGLLKPLDVAGAGVARLVEVNGAVGVRGEEAIEYDEVEVGVEGGAEAVEEGDGAELGVRWGVMTEPQEQRANRPQEDAEHGSGECRPAEEFLDYVEETAARIKAVPPANGFDEVLLPGEPEARSRVERLRDGIPLPEPIWNELTGLAESLGALAG